MNLLDENTMRTRRRREWETRRRDVGASRGWASADGFTFLELAVVILLAGLAIAISFSVLNKAPQNMPADVQDLALNLQAARGLAIGGGTHFRVRITSSTAYLTEAQASGWLTQRSLTLRPNVTFAAGDVGKIAEFDTRGNCVSTTPVTLTLTDSTRGWSKQVVVYARGMVDRP